jgi:hypothetical protein
VPSGNPLALIDVEPMTGENQIEIIETLIKILAKRVQAGLQQGGMVEPKELAGLQKIAEHLGLRIETLGTDPQQKQRAKQYGDIVGRLMNHIKAFSQRLQQAMQAQAKGNGGGQPAPDPKDAAKAQAMVMESQTKNQLATQSHAQRTAQRQVQFEQKLKQQVEQHAADIAATDIEAASKIRRQRVESESETGE